MKNINRFDYRSMFINRSREVSTFANCKAKFEKCLFLFLLLVTFNLNSFSQTRACDPTLVCIDYKIKLFDPSQNTWTIIDSTHCCPLHDFSQPQTPPFCQLMSMNQCECISNIRINGCLEGVLTVELYDTDSNYIRDLYVRNYNDTISDSCFTISDVGQYLLKFRHFVSNQTTIYGWYSFNVVSNTDFLDDITIVAPDEVCYGSDICFSISNVFFPITYWYFWNNTMLGHNSIGHETVPDSQTVCFQPQTLGINELKILMTDNCQDTTWYTKQINVKAFTNFSYPNPVCINKPFSINSITWCNGPISGASYVWNWGDGSANSYTQLPSHTYTSSGTYNITLTVSNSMGSQSMTKQIHVNALPVKPNVSGSFNNCKLTNTYTITNEQSGATYNWSATYCNTIPPGSASSKTITWFNNTNFPNPPLYDSIRIITNDGCIDTSYFRVWECCLKQGNPTYSDTVLTNSISSRQFYVNGNIQINNNITLELDTILMGPEAKFTVNSPYKLKIRVSSVKAGCNYMWDGIYPIFTGEIEIDTSTVSDAYNAIVSKNGAKYTLCGAKFNNNLYGIIVENYSGTHTGQIKNCIFSSVDVNGNASNLIVPYATRRGIAGIKITDVNNIQIGEIASVNNKNYFKHLDYGVKIQGSNVTLYNNSFGPLPKTSGLIFPDNGFGIFADSPSLNGSVINVGNANTSNVYRNSFDTCGIGIRTLNNYYLTIQRNSFRNNYMGAFITDNTYSSINIIYNSVSNQTFVGFWLNNFAYSNVDISSDSITNSYIGIYLSNNTLARTNNVQASYNYIGGNIYTGIILTNTEGYPSNSSSYWPRFTNNTISFSGIDLINDASIRSGIRIESSTRSIIEQNTIKYNVGLTDSIKAHRLAGVYLTLSTYTYLCSNVFDSLGLGVRIQGNCDRSKFILNQFRKGNTSRKGWGFRCFSATVGAQGTSTYPPDNRFINYSGMIRGVGSMDSYAAWYYKSYNTQLTFSRIYDQEISITNNPSSSINTPSCGYPAGGGSDFLINSGADNSFGLANTPNIYVNNVEENNYFERFVNENHDFSDTNSVIEGFENISSFKLIANFINEKNYADALLLNQSISPINTYEYNLKTTNDIYLRTWALGNYNLSSEDYNTLAEIGMQNPMKGGFGVINAWVMTQRFDDSDKKIKHDLNVLPKTSSEIIIFPNPTSQSATISGVRDVSKIIVYNLIGKIELQINNEGYDFVNITTGKLSKGVYLVKMQDVNGNRISVQKLVIE